MTRVVLDGLGLDGREGQGVARVLRQVVPLLVSDEKLDAVILATEAGATQLKSSSAEIVTVSRTLGSRWEQFELPHLARKLGARAVYRNGQSASLWGPRTVLHLHEDPFVRWQVTPATSTRERVRRLYQRTAMPLGLRRHPIVVLSVAEVGEELRKRFGTRLPEVAIIPLGVDREMFHPDANGSAGDIIFHLGSHDPRDMSAVVLSAYARALEMAPDLPDLVIGGDLRTSTPQVTELAERVGVGRRLRLLGRIGDEELRCCYARAVMCVQPSRYEGFGLQPLEALACGAPVVVVREPAVLEVVGDAAFVVDEPSPALLADAMAELWGDKGLRARLAGLGPKRAGAFPWSTTAEELRECLVRVADR